MLSRGKFIFAFIILFLAIIAGLRLLIVPRNQKSEDGNNSHDVSRDNEQHRQVSFNEVTPERNRKPTSSSIAQAPFPKKLIPGRAATTSEQGRFTAPFWSPDGAKLLFFDERLSSVYSKLDAAPDQPPEKTDASVLAVPQQTDEQNPETPIVYDRRERMAFDLHGNPIEPDKIISDKNLTGTYTVDDHVFIRLEPGQEARQITSGTDKYYGGVISPDKQFVAYNGLHTGIYVKKIGSPDEAVLLGEGHEPSWLSDSTGVIFARLEKNGENRISGSDLFFSSVDGERTVNLTNSPNRIELHPAVRPGGSEVAYESDGVIEIAVLNKM